MSILDSLGNTLKSLGGSVVAPLTTAYDLSTTEYHNATHGDWWNFGDYLHVLSHGAGQMLDPLSNDKTWTGYSIGKVMHGLDVAYKQGVDRPFQTLGLVSEQAGTHADIGAYFDGENWSKAWDLSRTQSLGQAVIANYANTGTPSGGLGLLASLEMSGSVGSIVHAFDHFNKKPHYQGSQIDEGVVVRGGKTLSPFEQSWFAKQHPGAAGTLAAGTDIALQWFLDPGVLAGKGAGMLRNQVVLHQLSDAERANLFDRINDPTNMTGVKRFIPVRQDLHSRVNQAIDYSMGENALKRPLTAPEIHAAFKPMLGSQGKDVADLWSQALKMDAPVEEKYSTVRRLLAVAGGDPNAIYQIRQEATQAGSIADALENIRKQGVTELTLQTLNQDSRFSPELLGEAQRQIDNLDDAGQVSDFVSKWVARKADEFSQRREDLAHLADVGGTMDFVPGAKQASTLGRILPGPQGQADKALLRENHQNVMNKMATLFERDRIGESTLWQKSLNQMPLVVAKGASVLTAPWLKAPAAIDNSLRQVHYIGVANLHDWAGSTDQLDSMLRLMGADDATRLNALDKAFSARSELEKRAAIEHVERVAMDSFAKQMSSKYGHDIDSDYVRNLVMNGQYQRQQGLTSLQGVQYSATRLPEDSPLRQGGLSQMEGEAKALARQTPDGSPTVDTFGHQDGVPVHLPILESQLANKVPLLDAHMIRDVFNTNEKVKRFSELGQAWKNEALDLGRLQARLARAKGASADRLAQAIYAKQRGMDALTDAGQMMTRVWKYSVLMRLGFPMRVLSDDNARISAIVPVATHYLDNGREGMKAWWHNRAPAAINGGGLKAQAAQKFIDEQGRRQALILQYGHRRPHSDEEFDSIVGAARTLVRKSATDEEQAAARQLLDKADPEGHIAEYYQKIEEHSALKRSAGALRGNLTRWRGELEAGTGNAEDLRRKIAQAEHDLADREQAMADKLSSLPDESPNAIRLQLKATNDLLTKGEKAFRDGKIHIGDADVPLGLPGLDPATGKPWASYGAFAGPYGESSRAAASSSETYHQVLTDGEERLHSAAKTGLWKTFTPQDPGHIYAWQDVLNHQVRNSSVAMWFIHHPEGTVDDFRAWLADPARTHLHERLPYLTHDPEAWYHRVKPMVDELTLNDPMVRDVVKNGRVSASTLKRIDIELRPNVHGAALDYNLGRNTAARMVGNGANAIMRFLAEAPTDRLSRQPFFNTVYKAEVRRMSRLHFDAAGKAGREFTAEDLRYIERQARKKALHHVKSYLWDISAHSHAAHVLRFISPFFAAHQEALNRWWRIAKEDPSVVRRFQLAFDAPRHFGLVYDANTGEPVKPGESISSNHRILLRIPWEGDRGPLNTWLRKIGGDKYWSINENGLNTILQGGLTNPGSGPIVSLPAGWAARHYANDTDIVKAANILTGGYIPDSNTSAVLPGALAKVVALATKNGQYDSLMSQNTQDRLVKFKEHNQRNPTDAELQNILQMAAHDTNRDLWMMAASNEFGFTPARPNSKYAAIQEGFNRIRAKAEAEGHDFIWMKQQFEKQYGQVYDMLITSSSSNPAGLTGTPAEVNAYEKYKNLIGKVSPLTAKLIIGPEAAGAKGAQGQYSPLARQALENAQPSPASKQTLIEAKDPQQIALGSLVDQGWNQYDELTNWLNYTARNQGLQSFYDSPQLMDLYRQGRQQILDSNFAFRNAWNQATVGDQYDQYLDEMRMIASSKKLNDTARPDIAYLKQYLQVRDWVSSVLQQRAAAGGSASPQAAANQPLLQFFSKYVIALTTQSSYFNKYAYQGIIEHDPLLLGVQ